MPPITENIKTNNENTIRNYVLFNDASITDDKDNIILIRQIIKYNIEGTKIEITNYYYTKFMDFSIDILKAQRMNKMEALKALIIYSKCS